MIITEQLTNDYGLGGKIVTVSEQGKEVSFIQLPNDDYEFRLKFAKNKLLELLKQ